jgi:hypothetical protein
MPLLLSDGLVEFEKTIITPAINYAKFNISRRGGAGCPPEPEQELAYQLPE